MKKVLKHFEFSLVSRVSSMQRFFTSLYSHRYQHPDVTLVLGDVKIPAHRLVRVEMGLRVKFWKKESGFWNL